MENATRIGDDRQYRSIVINIIRETRSTDPDRHFLSRSFPLSVLTFPNPAFHCTLLRRSRNSDRKRPPNYSYTSR